MRELPARANSKVSVPFNAGRGLMHQFLDLMRLCVGVSVPFNAGRGLMQPPPAAAGTPHRCFSTLQCGSWIDATLPPIPALPHRFVSVPFNAGRGLMRHGSCDSRSSSQVSVPFNAGRGLMRAQCAVVVVGLPGFSTLQCGSWIDAADNRHTNKLAIVFQYPSMRVVD